MTLLILNDVRRNNPVEPELSQKAVKAVKPAEGARSELESRLLNALRRQRFASPGALAKFTKQDDGDVRDALNELIARKLVTWQDESISTAGSGYVATTELAKNGNTERTSSLPAWVDKLGTL